MTNYKYVLPRFSLQAKIQRLECTKETAKFVTLIDRFNCEEKRSKANGVFNTWEGAHAALTRLVKNEQNEVRLRLQFLQRLADEVQSMEPQP